MSKLLLQQILSGQIKPVSAPQTEQQPRKNPFLQGSGSNGDSSQEQGVNRPLRHPLFVGYRDNKPIYAGSRLFVLY